MGAPAYRGPQDGIRTAGVLLREGATRDRDPHLQVLEIGQANAARKSSDLLPTLPAFRTYFEPLPRKASSFKLKASAVRLNAIRCITQTVLKVSFYQAYNTPTC